MGMCCTKSSIQYSNSIIKANHQEENNNSLNNKSIEAANHHNKNKVNSSMFVYKKPFSNLEKQYKIIGFLGKGAFGTVQKVKHLVSGDIRAMKIIIKAALPIIEDESSLFKEVEILKTLDHPNILKIYEFYYDSKNYYIITELCKGGELFDKVEKLGNFSEKLTASIIKQILQGVAYFHSKGIIHRDLKPENILIEEDSNNTDDKFNIKIIDFGASSTFKSKQIFTELVGTIYYMAPEIIKKNYNSKCDIWSVGVIMYILLTGEPLFSGRSDSEILKKLKKPKSHLNTVFNYPLLLSNSSNEAISILKKMLVEDPKLRYSAASLLNDAWIKNNAPTAKLDINIGIQVINNLRSFNVNQKLTEVSISFIVNQLISQEEIKELKNTFLALDKNNDGKLSYKEIIEGYSEVYGEVSAEANVINIFKCLNKNIDSFISYQEFITASIDRTKIITDKKLEAAFNLFDKDGNGSICSQELKHIIGKRFNNNDEYWNNLVKEVDQNGDGEISLDEFKNLMMKVLDWSKDKGMQNIINIDSNKDKIIDKKNGNKLNSNNELNNIDNKNNELLFNNNINKKNKDSLTSEIINKALKQFSTILNFKSNFDKKRIVKLNTVSEYGKSTKNLILHDKNELYNKEKDNLKRKITNQEYCLSNVTSKRNVNSKLKINLVENASFSKINDICNDNNISNNEKINTSFSINSKTYKSCNTYITNDIKNTTNLKNNVIFAKNISNAINSNNKKNLNKNSVSFYSCGSKSNLNSSLHNFKKDVDDHQFIYEDIKKLYTKQIE